LNTTQTIRQTAALCATHCLYNTINSGEVAQKAREERFLESSTEDYERLYCQQENGRFYASFRFALFS
jgi:hypothetical protein